MAELSSSIVKGYGGNRVFNTYQTQDQVSVALYQALTIESYSESDTGVTFNVIGSWGHNAYLNTIAYEFGYYYYNEGDTTTRYAVSSKIGVLNTPVNLQNYTISHSFTVPKNSTSKKIVLPYFKIGGVQYPSQDPWPGWQQTYGVLWIRTDSIVSAYHSSFVYAGQTLTAGRVVASTSDGTSQAYADGIVIPGITTPDEGGDDVDIYVPPTHQLFVPSGTTNVYVPDTSSSIFINV